MIKNILFWTLMCTIISCTGQNHPSKAPDSLITSVTLSDSNFILNPDKKMQILADSLNILSDTGSLPLFLFDKCFDYQTALWPSMHNPISLRKLLLSKVINVKLIERVINLNQKELKELCDIKSNIIVPEISTSTYDLFKERYRELRESKTR